jgi:hypothetical protein
MMRIEKKTFSRFVFDSQKKCLTTFLFIRDDEI